MDDLDSLDAVVACVRDILEKAMPAGHARIHVEMRIGKGRARELTVSGSATEIFRIGFEEMPSKMKSGDP